jgi:hypothetical protein
MIRDASVRRSPAKLLTLDEALRPTLPAFLSLLEVAVEDAAWKHLNALQRRQHIADTSLGALKQRLIAWTEGNPFFLEEIVQTLLETHALVGERGPIAW